MNAGRLIRSLVWWLVVGWLGAVSAGAGMVSGDSPNTVVDSRDPLVANVRVGQRVGTKLVDVDYDLSRVNGPINVRLQVSSDGGVTWTVPVTSATGALGASVTAGTDKRVTWDAGVDWNGQYSTQMRFRVVVEDMTAPTDFVAVAGGKLPVSSPLGAQAVDAFLIGKYEVQWGEFQTVRTWAVANGYDIGSVGAGTGSNYPVTTVSWYQALKWCNARSEKEGKTPVYLVSGAVYRTGNSVPTVDGNANGYRLPLEAEWEWAARGGVSSLGYTYSGSNTIDNVAWYATNSGGATKVVGTKAANELGIYDMSGNVWEWCWDASGANRQYRGGNWLIAASFCTVVYRNNYSPIGSGSSGGFRVVLSSVSWNADSSDSVVDSRDPLVANVRVGQRVGTTLVDVDYDLSRVNGPINVRLQVSSDGGVTWTVPVTSATGALGASVTAGTDKRVTWDAGVDWNGRYSTQMRFRVVADPSDFVTVAAGTLPVSSPLGAVAVGMFNVGRYEVQWGEFQAVQTWAAANGYDIGGVGAGVGSNYPVTNVSWYQVVKWCNARSEREGKTPVYLVSGAVYRTGDSVPTVDGNANGYRLPLEAEWEWAARGGVSSQGYTYSGSNTIGAVAWYTTNSGSATKAVGTKAANEIGIYDMSGNVWEWCWDTSGANRRNRGGSWNGSASVCTVVYRFSGTPTGSVSDLGFRVALSSVSWNADSSDSVVDSREVLVSNVRAGQRAGTKLVDVDYDYLGVSGTANVVLKVSSDGGVTWTVPVTSATGAVGASVVAGTNKRITWDAGVDWNGQYTTQMRFRVEVDTGMVSVMGGTLPVSSPMGAVAVGTYSIGKYEVQWEEFQMVRTWAAANGYDIGAVGAGVGSNYPVANVSWYQAVKWCNARSEKEGRTPVYLVSGAVYRTGNSVPMVDGNANGYRLPLEAEWEWAARGGLQSQGYTYSGSNTVDDVAWYTTNSGGATKAAGTKVANELGIYDMSGNVNEWCWDLNGANRQSRGGGRVNSAIQCTVGYRATLSPTGSSLNDGFRIVSPLVSVLSSDSGDRLVDSRDPVVITSQPVGATVNPGDAVSLSVTATGTGPLSYQWRKGGVNIVGATSATYAIGAAVEGDEGSYTVVVTNGVGSVTSAAALVSVNDLVITAQPVGLTVNPSAVASFSVTAVGVGTLTYQWRKDGVNIAGATSSTYTIASVQQGDEGNYTVLVRGALGSVTSTAAALSVNDSVVISRQPVGATVNPGAAVTLRVTATGTGPLAYQWQKGGVDIVGATSATYAIGAAVEGDEGSYAVVVTNVVGSVTSRAVALSVNDPVVITVQPVGLTVNEGLSASLSVVATGTGPLTYQWRRNGVNVNRATASTLTFPRVVGGNAGEYTVVVGNAVGSVVSSGAELVVVERPVVVTQPVSRYVTAGDLHTVTVGIRGSEPLSYQWYRKLKGGVGVGELIAGATSATYTLPAMVADVGGTNAVAGDYWVRVTNAAGEVTTQAARLWEGGPAISELADRAQALPGPARLGGTLVFRSVFQCIGTLTMGWYRGGVGLVHDEAGWSGGVPTKSDAVSIVNREIGVPGEGLWESVLTVGRVTAASVGRYAVTVRETVSGSVATREIGPVTVAGPARPQTITFSAIGNKRVGDRPFDLRATSGSGLPVTVDILRGSEVVTLGGAAGRTVTLIPGMTGLVVLRATQAGNSTFSAAVPVVRAFLVTSSDMAAYRRVTASRHRFNDASPNFASHVMGIRFDGTMWGWGLNDAGQTGTGGGELVVTPQPVMPERKWLDVSAGELFTVAIAVDGTLWGWGANGAGQLGNGTGAGSAVPVQVSGITGWVSVSAGREHALGIRLNENGLRELWGWGGNGYGQVGDGSMASRFEPVRIGGATDHWLSASAGDQHSLGIRARVAGATHGELMAWGDNAMGQLGTGNRVSSLQPVAVGKDNWRVVDAGVLASAGIDSAGKLATWGLGDSGKLGHGTTGQSVLAPLRIPTLTGQTFRSVSYGRSHVVALTSGGEMYTWGNNVHGQCGSLDTNQYLPRLILPYQGNVRWVQGVAGNAQTLLVSNTMTFCPVGYANQGELGLGFLKSTWLAASGSAVPRARFEVTMAPPAEVRVGADGSVAVAVGMIQPSTLINPVAIWTADGGSVVAYGAQTYTLTASTEPGLTLPDGSRVVVYVVVFPPGPDATRVPREVGFTVRGTIPANRLGSPQTLEFPFPAIPVR